MVVLAGALGLAGCAGDGPALRPAPVDSVGEAGAASCPGSTFSLPPLPPGLEAAALRTDVEGAIDAASTMSLQRVLLERLPVPSPSPPPPAPLDDEAARALGRGLEAIAAGRDLVALAELQRADELAPGRPGILRPLARTRARLGGPRAAEAIWIRLADAAPTDVEAAVAVAEARLRGGRDDEALDRLAPVFADREGSGRPSVHAAAVLRGRLAARPEAARLLHGVLVRLGHPAAALEAAEPAIEAAFDGVRTEPFPEPAALLLAAGDLELRLGRISRADRAWAAAAAQLRGPVLELECRRLRLLAGRVARGDAGTEALLAARLVEVFTAPDAGLRALGPELVAWALGVVPDPERLRDAVAARAAQRGVVEAALAVAPPDEAIALRSRRWVEAPGDFVDLERLLRLLALEHADHALGFAGSILVDRPEAVDEVLAAVEHALAEAVIDPGPATPADDPMLVVVRTRLLLRAGSVEAAWTHAAPLLEDPRWAGHAAVRRLDVDLAAALDDPRQLRIALARAERVDDPWLAIAAAHAWRRLEDPRAVEAARAAVRAVGGDPEARAGGPLDAVQVAAFDALLEAEWQAAEAAPVDADRAEALRALGEHARAFVQRAPASRLPWRRLRGLLAGATGVTPVTFERDVQAIADDAGMIPPAAQRELEILLRERDLRSSRAERALDRALRAWRGDAADETCLEIAWMVWALDGRVEDAIAWLEDRLAERPADRRVLAALMRAFRSVPDADRAELLLASRLLRAPGDVAAAQQLEWHLDWLERHDEHAELVLARLRSRPPSGRRSLQQAVAEADRGEREQAAARLAELPGLAAENAATLRHLLAGAELASRLGGAGDAVLVEIVRSGFEHFPGGMSLHLAGQALDVLARRGDAAGVAFLARRAAERSTVVGLPDWARAAAWSSVARRLVEAGRPDAAADALRAVFARVDGSAGVGGPGRTLVVAPELATMALAAEVAAGRPVDPELLEAAGDELGRRRHLAGLLELVGRIPEAIDAWEAVAMRVDPAPGATAITASVRPRLEALRLRLDGGGAPLGDDARRREETWVRSVLERTAGEDRERARVVLARLMLARSDAVGPPPEGGGPAVAEAMIVEAEVVEAVSLLAGVVERDRAADPVLRLHYGEALRRAGRLPAAEATWRAAREGILDRRALEARARELRVRLDEAWGLTPVDADAIVAERAAGILADLDRRIAEVEAERRASPE